MAENLALKGKLVWFGLLWFGFVCMGYWGQDRKTI